MIFLATEYISLRAEGYYMFLTASGLVFALWTYQTLQLKGGAIMT
jgi:hypothetical protein